MYEGAKVAVVIPCYNEEKLIGRVIDSMPELVDRIFVVDDKSPDGTVQVVEEYVKTSPQRISLIQHEVNQGVGGAISSGNAAMEIVKTSGGNWAEHVWVEEQLRVARFQPDANDAAARNRELYDEFAASLGEVSAF